MDYLTSLRTAIDAAPAVEIPEALRRYDTMHRRILSVPADFNYCYAHIKRALLALARGEKSDKIGIMLWLKEAKLTHYRELDPVHTDWFTDVKDRWVKDFILRPCPERYTPDERRRIRSLLLTEDLTPWL